MEGMELARHTTAMGFGKHSKETYAEIYESFPNYCDWALEQPSPGGKLAQFVQWLTEQPRYYRPDVVIQAPVRPTPPPPPATSDVVVQREHDDDDDDLAAVLDQIQRMEEEALAGRARGIHSASVLSVAMSSTNNSSYSAGIVPSTASSSSSSPSASSSQATATTTPAAVHLLPALSQSASAPVVGSSSLVSSPYYGLGPHSGAVRAVSAATAPPPPPAAQTLFATSSSLSLRSSQSENRSEELPLFLTGRRRAVHNNKRRREQEAVVPASEDSIPTRKPRKSAKRRRTTPTVLPARSQPTTSVPTHNNHPDSAALHPLFTCKVCLSQAVECINLPCSHLATCVDCSLRLPGPVVTCVLCRQPLDEIRKVYV